MTDFELYLFQVMRACYNAYEQAGPPMSVVVAPMHALEASVP